MLCHFISDDILEVMDKFSGKDQGWLGKLVGCGYDYSRTAAKSLWCCYCLEPLLQCYVHKTAYN